MGRRIFDGMKMKDWSLDERPREKMLRRGAGNLSNAELLAIFIGSGVPGTNAVAVGSCPPWADGCPTWWDSRSGN